MSSGAGRRSYSIVCEQEENGKWICLTDSFPRRNIPNVERTKRISIDRTGSGFLLPPVNELLRFKRRPSEANSLPYASENKVVQTVNVTEYQTTNYEDSLTERNISKTLEKLNMNSQMKTESGIYMPEERFRSIRRKSESCKTFGKNVGLSVNESRAKHTIMEAAATCVNDTQIKKGLYNSRRLSIPVDVEKYSNLFQETTECAGGFACYIDEFDASLESYKKYPNRKASRLSESNNTGSAQIKRKKQTGTFVISKFGTEKAMSKGGKQESLRRTSLPNPSSCTEIQLTEMKAYLPAVSLSEQGTKKIHSEGPSYKDSDNLSGRIPLPDIQGVGNKSLHQRKFSEAESESETKFSSYFQKNSKEFKANRRLSAPISNKTCETTTHFHKSGIDARFLTSVEETGKILLRRNSEPSGNIRSRYEPHLPAVRDISGEGIDIQKWLETLQACSDDSFENIFDSAFNDEPEDESEQTHSGRVSQIQHRSISQSATEEHNEQEFRMLGIESDVYDGKFIIEDTIGRDNEIDKDITSCRNVSAMDRCMHEREQLNTVRMRRHTIATDQDNFIQDLMNYKPKTCWCMRCQIMNALYFNGDGRLVNWGNYPCFRR